MCLGMTLLLFFSARADSGAAERPLPLSLAEAVRYADEGGDADRDRATGVAALGSRNTFDFESWWHQGWDELHDEIVEEPATTEDSSDGEDRCKGSYDTDNIGRRPRVSHGDSGRQTEPHVRQSLFRDCHLQG